MLNAHRNAADISIVLGNTENKSGISSINMYRMSRLVSDDLSHMSFTLDTHRVLHSLLHWTCRDLPEWSPVVRQPTAGYRARSVVLRETAGIISANSNRNLRSGIEELEKLNIFQ